MGQAGPDPPTRGPVVLLAGPGSPTAIVYRYLATRLPGLVLVTEDPVPRLQLTRRRARRLGWPCVAGQVALITLLMPLLSYRSKARAQAILRSSGLDDRPVAPHHHVTSVNSPQARQLLAQLQPALVILQGTRIVSAETLASVPAPFINLHAGLTPRYRGVHGGYWALAEGCPELAGSTVHLVDKGVDTGGILGQATFRPRQEDSIATYPYLHLACGLPVLARVATGFLAGEPLVQVRPLDGAAESSVLRWHPTLWGYLCRRVLAGVR
jgi:folate-dependent phosphoribosylglycinamide formyltransferase PurN